MSYLCLVMSFETLTKVDRLAEIVRFGFKPKNIGQLNVLSGDGMSVVVFLTEGLSNR